MDSHIYRNILCRNNNYWFKNIWRSDVNATLDLKVTNYIHVYYTRFVVPAIPLSINLFVLFVGQSMLGQPLVRSVQGQRNTKEYLFAMGAGAPLSRPPQSAIKI